MKLTAFFWVGLADANDARLAMTNEWPVQLF